MSSDRRPCLKRAGTAIISIFAILFLTKSVWGQQTSLQSSQQIALQDLTAFNAPADHWQIVGNASVNPLVEHSFKTVTGRGVLVGAASSLAKASNLETRMRHGDMDVTFDVLLSHQASAAIWLQGRYGLQLSDSWGKRKLTISENGNIIPPESGGVSSLGYLARMNVARAPGTWQHLRIVFEAPRYNAKEEKTRNARIVSVEQNGVVIQKNKYLSGPSQRAPYRDEVAEGPLTFRIDSGQIAIRNIRYIKFTDQRVHLDHLTYRLYLDQFLDDKFIYWDGAEGDNVPIPDLASRKPAQTGTAERINTRMVRGKGRDFVLVFEGQLHLPKPGEYKFEVVPHGVGAFELDDNELLRWDALHQKGKDDVTVNLQEGSRNFRLIYVNFEQPRLGLFVEGPGLKRQQLHEEGSFPEDDAVQPIVLTPAGAPLIQRSFLFHKGNKLLTCMSVGSPQGVHYSINMATGALVQAWRGPFADASPMWHFRGKQQVLLPLGSVLSFDADQQASLAQEQLFQSAKTPHTGDYKRVGYTLNSSGGPVFEYIIGSIHVQDDITVERTSPTLKRVLRFRNRENTTQTVWYRIATSQSIEQVSGRLYAIGDKTYFVEVGKGATPEIKQDGKKELLLIPLQVGTHQQSLIYSVIW